MPKVVNREQLLKELECVTPGLSPRGIVEQSDCFAFLKGKVVTFNDEIACSTACCLRVTGAVQAKPLLDLLRKLPEETVEISVDEGKLVIKGKKRRARIAMEKEISLPFKSVGEPKKWTTLPADFLEAVNLVHRCAGKDEQKLEVYVHVHPDKVEACMEHQVGHFRTHTDIKKPVLIHKDSIKHIVSLGMTEFGVGEAWTHFKNANDLILSCRCVVEEDFPDTSKALAVKGAKINLPKGLADAAERANIFSQENADDDDVLVTLKPGKVIVVGTGSSGDFRETKTVKYDGEEMTFMISPKLLADITMKHNEAWITPDTLKVKSGKFTYVTALGSMDEKADGEGKEGEKETASAGAEE
jgi:DNA polymerase III sliding clamp (beta) subunit (PCNA family)